MFAVFVTVWQDGSNKHVIPENTRQVAAPGKNGGKGEGAWNSRREGHGTAKKDFRRS